VKRRAFLLAGALLMPTAAAAKTAKRPAKRQPPRKSAVAPASLSTATQPLLQARSQLVGFNASAFPYRGFIPGTSRPFLDARDGGRRGHTGPRGDVFWETPTFNDRRSLLYLPPGFDARKPVLIVLYLHGQGATLERDVVARQGVPRQIAGSQRNAALVAPQLAVDAADSSPGNFWRPGHFAAYLDESAERLMRLHGDRNAGRQFNMAPVVIVAYSGGYLSAAYALDRGGANHRIRGVILMDALYGEEGKFAAWIAARRRQAFLLSAFTESTRDENARLQGLLQKRRVPFSRTVPATLSPGTVAFVSCGGLDRHGDFVTNAWRPDPLQHALSKIPGYLSRAKQGA
jgi:hypothetical protein